MRSNFASGRGYTLLQFVRVAVWLAEFSRTVNNLDQSTCYNEAVRSCRPAREFTSDGASSSRQSVTFATSVGRINFQ